MDAVSLLTNDHRVVDRLFEEYLAAPAGDHQSRMRIVHQITRELSIHAAIEEEVLYPSVKEALPDGDPFADEALGEHAEVKEVLAELDDMDAEQPEFDRKVRSLIEDVRHHVAEEEGEMFPKLVAAVPRERLEEMGEAMESAKAMAPTRPHPHAPDEPPGNVLVGAVAGLLDRGRDLISGRSRTTAKRTPAKTTAPKKTKKATTRKKAGGKSTAKTSRGKKSTSTKATARKRSTSIKATARKRRAPGPVIHVTTDPRGGWRAGARGSRPVARGDNKQDVVRRARDVAKSRSGRLVIHKQNGRIQEERTYGSDPRRSRG